MSEFIVCKYCGIERNVDQFLKAVGNHRGRCKSCRTEYNLANKERRDAWYAKNRESRLLKSKEYRDKNKEAAAAYKAQWYLDNKEMLDERSRQRYRNTDKDVLRDKELQKHYGITLEQRNNILESQGGVCAICSAEDDLTGKEFSIDHCHVTGVIRGILCSLCNTGIGMLGDNAKSVKKALDYLIEAEDKINKIVEKVDIDKQL